MKLKNKIKNGHSGVKAQDRVLWMVGLKYTFVTHFLKLLYCFQSLIPIEIALEGDLVSSPRIILQE